MLINILDIGFGNIASVKNALDFLGYKSKISKSNFISSSNYILAIRAVNSL